MACPPCCFSYDETYDCYCDATYEDDSYYYEEQLDQAVCLDPDYADLVVEDAVEDCAATLSDAGHYNIECSCICDPTGEECVAD